MSLEFLPTKWRGFHVDHKASRLDPTLIRWRYCVGLHYHSSRPTGFLVVHQECHPDFGPG